MVAFGVALWVLMLAGGAVHELGHWVVLRRLGIPAADLRMRLNVVGAGRVELRHAGEWLPPNDPRFGPSVWARAPRRWGQMVMLAAGLGAQLALYVAAGFVARSLGWADGAAAVAVASAVAWLGSVPIGDGRAMHRLHRPGAWMWIFLSLAVVMALVWPALTS